MRGIQLNPTYSAVVQPWYMYISVSGCVLYSYASGFQHICMSAPLLANYLYSILTETHSHSNTHWQTHKC